MFASMQTLCFQGLTALPVQVQVQIAPGLPSLHLVGLPDKAVAESKERIRSALYSMNLALPAKRITINLSPADLRKEGSHYDLPIALALLSSMGACSQDTLNSFIALGELGLNGNLIPVGNGLCAAIASNAYHKNLLCALEDGPQAAWAGEMNIVAAPSLLAALQHFKGKQVLPAPQAKQENKRLYCKDIKDVKGQSGAKRALEIAAAGCHNLLMVGPPGAGKSMLAERLISILPPLMPEEALEVTMIHSLSGLNQAPPNSTGTSTLGLIVDRPFRAPHHSASVPSLIGGGMKANPGEISLAHAGVLFLDELPEWGRTHLEALRQPLESGLAVIARANEHITYPADFQMIAAMNPCPCGHLASPEQQCYKAPACADSYQKKLSGPLKDRLDMQIHMESISSFELFDMQPGESSETVRQRVSAAHTQQRKRLHKESEGKTQHILNGRIMFHALEPHLHLQAASKMLLEKAALKWKLSSRGCHKVLRLARTIADLASSPEIKRIHIAEALSYRQPAFTYGKAA